MATFGFYKTRDGKRRIIAVVAIKGFKKSSRSFDAMRDAKDWATNQERDLRGLRDRGGARTDVTTLTIADLAKAYLADPKVRQNKSIAGIETLIATWVDEWGSEKLRSFGYLHIVALRDKLLSSGLSPGRVNRYVSQLRAAWNWGKPYYVQNEWPQKIMLEEPKPEAINRKYGTTEATLADVREVITKTDLISKSLGNLVRFLIGTGARVSDALAVRWADIDQDAGVVTLRGEKTEQPLRVAMLAPALEAIKLEGASKVKHVSNRVFWQFDGHDVLRSPWRRARKTFPEALTKLRLHDCRHLCASFLARNGASHVELAAQLGHTSLSMVKRYASLSGGHRGAAHDRLDTAFSAADKK